MIKNTHLQHFIACLYSEVSTVLAMLKDKTDEKDIGRLAALLAVEYYEQLGPLLPSDSFLRFLSPPVVLLSPFDSSSASSNVQNQHIALQIPVSIPRCLPSLLGQAQSQPIIDLASFLLKHPMELVAFMHHVNKRGLIQFNCKKIADSGQNITSGNTRTFWVWE